MLIKTKINRDQKYVKINDPSLEEFLNAALLKFSMPTSIKGIRVYDETGTEVDADMFEEVVQEPNTGVFTIRFDSDSLVSPSISLVSDDITTNPENSLNHPDDMVVLELVNCDSDGTIVIDENSPSRKRERESEDAKHLVESVLAKKPGGERIMKEYNRSKSLTNSSRRQLVNILVADMTEIHGTTPPRDVREKYARGIIEVFPYLMDPYSKNGYEHFYDPESGSGYLAWRLKTIQRRSSSADRRRPSRQPTGGGPRAKRDASYCPEVFLSEVKCKEAISFMRYTPNEASVQQKMKMTFEYRRNMLLRPQLMY